VLLTPESSGVLLYNNVDKITLTCPKCKGPLKVDTGLQKGLKITKAIKVQGLASKAEKYINVICHVKMSFESRQKVTERTEDHKGNECSDEHNI